jgi:hypothetical protein
MKKIVSLLIIGLSILLLLSFMPTNTIDNIVIDDNQEKYLTLVPAVPAKPPTK